MIIKTKERAHLLFVVSLESTTFSCCQICLYSLVFLEVMKEILCLIALNIIALILFEAMLILRGFLHLQSANIVMTCLQTYHSWKEMHPGVSDNFTNHQYSHILCCPCFVILLFPQVPKYLDVNRVFSGLPCRWIAWKKLLCSKPSLNILPLSGSFLEFSFFQWCKTQQMFYLLLTHVS